MSEMKGSWNIIRRLEEERDMALVERDHALKERDEARAENAKRLEENDRYYFAQDEKVRTIQAKAARLVEALRKCHDRACWINPEREISVVVKRALAEWGSKSRQRRRTGRQF